MVNSPPGIPAAGHGTFLLPVRTFNCERTNEDLFPQSIVDDLGSSGHTAGRGGVSRRDYCGACGATRSRAGIGSGSIEHAVMALTR